MKTLLTRVLICCLLFCLTAAARAADYDGGTQSPLRFGVGARELSLGAACIARCDAATAPFWNPARLADVEYVSFGAFHSNLFESDVAYQYVGLAVPTLDFGTVGIGVQRLAVQDIELRDADNMLAGSFDDSRMGVYLAYGKRFGDYRAGAALSVEHHSLHDYSATSSPGLSLALMRSFGLSTGWLRSVDVVVAGSNLLSQSLELGQEPISEPASADAAFDVTLAPENRQDHTFRLSTRLRKVDGLDVRTAVGLEYSYRGLLSLRGGLRDSEWSAGAGIGYRWFSFDYALVDRPLGLLHMFAVTSAFGSSMSERREMRELARETEFQDKMLSTLRDRNNRTVDQLVASGRQAMAAGIPGEASILFDRALFVAHSSGLDTTDLAGLLAEARQAYDLQQLRDKYASDLDSARACVERGDLLSARYFSSAAVEAMPDSLVAVQLLQEIDRRLETDRSGEARLAAQIRQIDSLLTYGRYDVAVSRARSLKEIAPDNEAVTQLVRRAEFEAVRNKGNRALAAGDYSAALAAMKTAEELYPYHPWCESVRNRVRQQKAATPAVSQPTAAAERPELSETARQEAEELYRVGQAAFERGEFEDAIASWERVEVIAADFQSVREYLVRAYKYLGVEHYSNNELPRALAVWRRAAELMPENEEIASYIQRAEAEMTKIRELSYEQ